jgi:hypothetical protein
MAINNQNMENLIKVIAAKDATQKELFDYIKDQNKTLMAHGMGTQDKVLNHEISAQKKGTSAVWKFINEYSSWFKYVTLIIVAAALGLKVYGVIP